MAAAVAAMGMLRPVAPDSTPAYREESPAAAASGSLPIRVGLAGRGVVGGGGVERGKSATGARG